MKIEDNMPTVKRIGRPRLYEQTAGRNGAPKLNIRCDPTIYVQIMGVPEGARDYIERLVWDDIRRIAATGGSSSQLTSR